MKMLLAIVHNEDAPLLINELNEKKYFVTKLATTGGFLKKETPPCSLVLRTKRWMRYAILSNSIPANASRSCTLRRHRQTVMYTPMPYPPYP